jgi:hypothetical protein
MGDKMKEDFYYFIECLKKAGAEMDEHYFQLTVANSEEAIFRERVYCYELYHQLRNALGEKFPYKLDGELDKAGHPIIRTSCGPKKPDFVIHVPGGMERNLTVIEVKPVTVKNNITKLRDDLTTLQCFIKYGEYYRGIMMVYANGEENPPESIVSEVKSFSVSCDGRILMVWHSGPKTKPKLINLG